MLKGSCLCGGVSIRVEGELEHLPEVCHCSQCRKQTGHVFAGVNVRKTALKLHGTENISWYQSSEKVRRGFCSGCGSTLFWQPILDGYEWTSVAMGVFDTPTGVRLAKHTFIADKGDYYDIEDGLPQVTGY